MRARAMLAAARPGFHEWPPSAYVPEPPDGGIPGATTGHLVGDFDGDGRPDVVFDGYEGRFMVVPAVLSNNGDPKVVPVVDSSPAPNPPALKEARLAISPDTLNGAKVPFGVEFVTFDRTGLSMVRSGAIRIYKAGRFRWLAGGE